MSPDMMKIIITVASGILVILMIFGLMKMMSPGSQEYIHDQLQADGYESMADIKKKEYTVISLGVFIIVLCLLIMAGLVFIMYRTGAFQGFELEDVESYNILFLFIPAIIICFFFINTSRRYIRTQLITLHEFRKFKATREKVFSEYESKRRGRSSEPEKPRQSALEQSKNLRSKKAQEQKRRRRK